MKHENVRILERGIIGLCITVLLAVFCITQGSCASNLGTGYRTMLVVMRSGDAAAKLLTEVGTAKHNACMKTPEKYKECIAAAKAATELWVKTLKPAINSALEVTWGVLETARKASEKNAKWLEKMKPAICSFIKALEQWESYLSKTKVSELLVPLKAVEGLLCQ